MSYSTLPPFFKKPRMGESSSKTFPVHCNTEIQNNQYMTTNLLNDILDKVVKLNALQKKTKESEAEQKEYQEAQLKLQHQIKDNKKSTKKEQKEDEKKLNQILRKLDKVKCGFKIMIYIDNREGRNNDLFKIFDQLDNGIVEKANLKSLDFIITLNDKFAYGFERKRLDDAVASTTSSHYASQTCKMKYLFQEHIGNERSRIVNILEKIRVQSSQKCECKNLHSTRVSDVLSDLNQSTYKLIHLFEDKKELKEKMQFHLKMMNDFCVDNKMSNASFQTCEDDKMQILSEETCFDGLSFDRNRIIGIPVNRMILEGFSNITSESDLFTCFWLLKIMTSIVKNGDLLMERWNHQPDFDLSQIEQAELKLSGEPLKEWLDSRELPKDHSLPSSDFKLNAKQRQWALQLLVLKNVTIDYVCLMVERWPKPAQFADYLLKTENAQDAVDELANLKPSKPNAKKFGYARAINLYNHFFGSDYGINKKNQVIAKEDFESDSDIDLDEEIME